MAWQAVPYVILLLAATAMSALLGLRVWWRGGREARATVGTIMLLAGCTWMMTYAFELLSTQASTKLFWRKMAYVGIAPLPTVWLIYTLLYTGHKRWITRPHVILLAIVPLITLSLVFTNEFHGLIWSNLFLHTEGPLPGLIETYGPWPHFFWAYSYLLFLLGCVMLLQPLFAQRRLIRRHIVLIIGLATLLLIANLVERAGFASLAGLDVEAFAFVLIGPPVAWVLFRGQLGRILPVAHKVVVQGMRDPVIVLNSRGRVWEFNAAAETLTGRRAGDVIGQDIAELLPDLSVQVDALPAGGSTTKEVVLEGDGTQRIYDCTLSSLVEDSEGALPKVIILRDVTDRRRAEAALREAHDKLERRVAERTEELVTANSRLRREIEERGEAEAALRESEEKYRALVENLSEIVYRTDQSGRVTYVSSNVESITGYSQAEVVAKHFIEFAHPEDLDERMPRFQEALAGNGSAGEYRVLTKDGKTMWMRTDARPIIEGGRPVGVQGVLTEITDLKKVEEALRQSEEKYRTLVESIQDGVVVIQDGRLRFVNEAFGKLIGYAAEEVIGMDLRQLMAPEDVDVVADWYARQQTGEQPPSEYELRLLHKDGEAISVNIHTGVAAYQGEMASVGTAKDITERKRAAEERRRLEARLEQSQRMEAIGTLAGGIAHDFNNLLMGIQGNASLMLLGVESSHPYHERLKSIEQCVQSGAELTRELLAFARGGKYKLELVDLNQLVKRTSDMFGHARKEIAIRAKFEKGVWAVQVDRSQIEQVMLNLLVNAWQAMPGGGNLYLQTKNVTLDEEYVKPYGVRTGRYVRVSVTDTGVGMDEATQQRMFDPFFSTKEMGRGLGLASVYGTITNHAGIVRGYSEKGKGSTFDVYLPASEREAVEEKKSAQEIVGGSETLLLVDDEDIITDSGGMLLQAMGYGVLIAKSGREAIDIYGRRRDQVDLVILDMIMPGMSGGETYRRLKEINPDIKVLLSSGYSLDGQATEILRGGCDGFIQKPFSGEELSQKIRQVLDTE